LFNPNVAKLAAKETLLLMRALRYKRDQRVRAAAAKALGIARARRAVPALAKALSDEYGFVGAKAAEALGEIADPAAVKLLIDVLNDKNEEIRAIAAVTFGKIRDRQAVPFLIKALSDNEWEVRRAAAEALDKLSDTEAVPPLIRDCTILSTMFEQQRPYLLERLAIHAQQSR
jgi:hypothetical protein